MTEGRQCGEMFYAFRQLPHGLFIFEDTMPRNFLGFVEIHCPMCNKEFTTTQRRVNQAKNRWKMYCSWQCKSKAGGISARKKLICNTPDGTEKQRKKACNRIRTLLKNGEIRKHYKCQLCEKLGNIDAHHLDYSKPSVVIWLCRSCHMNIHWEKKKDIKTGWKPEALVSDGII